MLQLNSDWQVNSRYREFVSLIIVVCIGFSLTQNFFDKGNYLVNLDKGYAQIYFMFAIPSIIFAIGLWLNRFYSWVYSFGVTSIPIGALVSQERISEFFSDLNNAKFQDSSLIWTITTVVPFVIILLSIVVLTMKQAVKFESNQIVERVSGVIGFLLSILLLWGEFLPWDRSIYKATSKQWTFQGSGNQLLVKECCYMTSYDLATSLKIILPIIFLAGLFLLQLIGFRLPTLMFSSGLVWCFQESLQFLTGLGIQDPLENTSWTSQQIETNGLSYLIEGMFGGYLFVFSFIGLIVTLLLPRVLTGRNFSDKH